MQSFMARYKDEPLGKELIKVYEHSKYKEESEHSSKTKRKTYNHPLTSRDEKSAVELESLKKELKQQKSENEVLNQKNEESL